MLTYRESKYVVERSKGSSRYQALVAAGFNHGLAKNPQFIESPEVLAEIEKYRAELVNRTVEVGLIDSVELLEQFTDELRGELSELYDYSVNPAGELRPIKDWPLWARQGGVEVIDEPNLVHSTDGGGSSWDVQGRKITVKLSPGHRAKIKELAMKHKAVDAMVQQKAGDTHNHLHMHAEIVKNLQGAKAREARLIEAAKPSDSE